MKIAVISGGSGNDKLIRGITSYYPDCDISVITNAYDDGKSTGICRKLTHTLGVSDIRKNHYRMYETLNCNNVDVRLKEFYEGRYDLPEDSDARKKYLDNKLVQWGLKEFVVYTNRFIDRPMSIAYPMKNFNIANIVYAEMYAQHGYEYTNKYFTKNILHIKDFVILNSFDNVSISAQLDTGKLLADEGSIVDLADETQKITKIYYSNSADRRTLNPAAIRCISEADLIVISSGTFWSSIYPTLEYGDFYQYINNSSSKKIWIMNNVEDKDSFGVTSNDFISIVSNLGLNLNDFTIIENHDADSTLKLRNDRYNICYHHLCNNNGKHDGNRLATAILSRYYGLSQKYDAYLLDFDDSIWARNDNLKNISKENVLTANRLTNCYIVSGNSYSSIYDKLAEVFGSELKDLNIKIWANANSTLYYNNQVEFVIDDFIIDNPSADTIVDWIEATLDINVDKIESRCIDSSGRENVKIPCLKIKPLENRERLILSKYLNEYFFVDANVAAKITGTSTIDIVTKSNNKDVILSYIPHNNAIYIGDEIDQGNDSDIARKCPQYVSTSGVKETQCILNLLTNMNLVLD